MLHPCSLELTVEEAEALQEVPPGVVRFQTPDGEHGDVWLDTFNVGWYDRADAERAAEYWGTVVVDVLYYAAEVKHPRREP